MDDDVLKQKIWDLMQAVRGGAESIQAVADRLDSELDLARSAQSAATLNDGSEMTIYEEGTAGDIPWEFGHANFDLSVMAAGDSITFRVYIKNQSGGTYRRITLDTNWTFNGVCDPPMPIFNERIFNQYGIKITMQQTLHPVAFKTVYNEFFDSKRGG